MNTIKGIDTAGHWDAGEAGCGRLVLGVKREFERLQSGEALSITARDSAAHIDLAHWCHMTGHELLSADHPNFVLRRKRRRG